jgi:hypothetical protein
VDFANWPPSKMRTMQEAGSCPIYRHGAKDARSPLGRFLRMRCLSS